MIAWVYFCNALILGWKHFIAFAILSASIIYFLYFSSIVIPADLKAPLFSAKIAVASITIATMTFYERTFWDRIESIERGKKENISYSDIVRYYSPGFILLFGGAFFAFLSVGVELYASLIDKTLFWVHVHLGLFFTCLILLFVFVIRFLGTLLGEMQTLKEVDDLRRKSTENEG